MRHEIDLTKKEWDGVRCQELEVARGELIEIRLEALPGTGYSWLLAVLGEGCVLHGLDIEAADEGEGADAPASFTFGFAITGEPGGEIVLRKQRLREEGPIASLSIALR